MRTRTVQLPDELDDALEAIAADIDTDATVEWLLTRYAKDQLRTGVPAPAPDGWLFLVDISEQTLPLVNLVARQLGTDVPKALRMMVLLGLREAFLNGQEFAKVAEGMTEEQRALLFTETSGRVN